MVGIHEERVPAKTILGVGGFLNFTGGTQPHSQCCPKSFCLVYTLMALISRIL